MRRFYETVLIHSNSMEIGEGVGVHPIRPVAKFSFEGDFFCLQISDPEQCSRRRRAKARIRRRLQTRLPYEQDFCSLDSLSDTGRAAAAVSASAARQREGGEVKEREEEGAEDF